MSELYISKLLSKNRYSNKQEYASNFHILQQKRRKSMSQFFTPAKQQGLQGQTSKNINKTPRDGDWFCYNCNNLNYSFRQKCNRCKVQTREQNQQIKAYYYECLPQNYYIHQKQNFPSLSNSSQHFSTDLKKKCIKTGISQDSMGSEHSFRTPKKQQAIAELPSVSPLVRRYNWRQNNSTQQSKNKGLFQNQTIWANINLKYQDQYQIVQNKDQGDDDKQEINDIQRVIQKMML